MKTFGKVVLSCCLLVGNVFAGGYVLSRFWSWFILAVFPSLPRLDVLHGIGIAMFANFLLFGISLRLEMIHKNINKEESTEDISDANMYISAATLFVAYPLSLLTGYVLHCLM
jgi:hypothetical protein